MEPSFWGQNQYQEVGGNYWEPPSQYQQLNPPQYQQYPQMQPPQYPQLLPPPSSQQLQPAPPQQLQYEVHPLPHLPQVPGPPRYIDAAVSFYTTKIYMQSLGLSKPVQKQYIII